MLAKFFRNSFRRFRSDLSDIFEDVPKSDFSKLPPIKKNNYIEHAETQKITNDEISEMMKDSEIITSEIIRPINKFDYLPVDQAVKSDLSKKFPFPTPIQKFSWPVALKGDNLVGLSVTGSGKTLSFAIPMIHHIAENLNTFSGKTLGLVLLPSWELARQVHFEITKYSSLMKIQGSLFVGGEPISSQMRRYASYNNFIVATPGRLMDLYSRGMVSLNNISYLVFDEADKMMDMGFEPQIRSITNRTRPDRQCTMWSATWPQKVSEIANDYIKDAFKIKVGKGFLTANKNIEQNFEFITGSIKIHKLIEILSKDHKNTRTIVFSNTMYSVDFITTRLNSEGIDAVGLHGKKDRFERTQIYNNFKNNRARVLVATDVASRGLDIDDVDLVIVYDMPMLFENYIHRIGRTGRNKKGKSIAFFTSEDVRNASNIVQVLLQAGQEVPSKMMALSGGGGEK